MLGIVEANVLPRAACRAKVEAVVGRAAMSSYVSERSAGSSPRVRSALALGRFLLLGVLLSLLGLFTTTPLVSAWYRHGPQPPWSPQLVAVTAIWTALYLVDGLAGWLLWRRPGDDALGRNAMLLYWVQLALQAGWLLAFVAQALVAGALLWGVFGVIVLLDLVTAAAAWASWRVSRTAAVLLALVLVWLLFGTVQSWSEMTMRTLGG